jgi:hypothetical protein
VDEQRDVPARWKNRCGSCRRRALTGAGLPSALSKESGDLGPRKQIRIPHPSMEGEGLGVVLTEGCGVHVVEDTYVAKDLPNSIG